YLTVTPELRVVVSKRIREEYNNGKEYYAMHGRELTIRPRRKEDMPARAFLEWHNSVVFKDRAG
ncbi:MAG: HNH endonuclease, partial [bacterium]|nr:HNH endonuclease [bacterium]